MIQSTVWTRVMMFRLYEDYYTESFAKSVENYCQERYSTLRGSLAEPGSMIMCLCSGYGWTCIFSLIPGVIVGAGSKFRSA